MWLAGVGADGGFELSRLETPPPRGEVWQIQGLTQGVAWGGLSLLDDPERCLPVSGREGASTLLLSEWEKDRFSLIFKGVWDSPSAKRHS